MNPVITNFIPIIIKIVAIFVTLFLFMIGLVQAFRVIWNPEAKRVQNELKDISPSAPRIAPATIRINQQPSGIPWLNKILSGIGTPLTRWFNRLLQQSDTRQSLGVFILLSLLLGISGFLIASKLSKSRILGLPAGALVLIVPFYYLSMKRKRRMLKFEEQLPDALDLISRALKAGQAFTGGLQMVGQEFDDPIGPEFEKTFTQINLGASYQDALRSLTERVDCPDLKFFAISVIIQRQSGGNLAEILENISRLVRERFKLRGHIRALAAEGKISAIILIALPFLIFLILSFMAPDYIKVLITEDIGKKMICGSLFMMALGVLVMKKMINIKV